MHDDPIIRYFDKLPDDKLMSEKHLAFLLEVSLSKVQKDRLNGQGVRFVKMNGGVRYRIGDYRKYIAQRTVTSTSEADGLVANYSGMVGGTPFGRVGNTIHGFVASMGMDVDEIIVGSVGMLRPMGYIIAPDAERETPD